MSERYKTIRGAVSPGDDHIIVTSSGEKIWTMTYACTELNRLAAELERVTRERGEVICQRNRLMDEASESVLILGAIECGDIECQADDDGGPRGDPALHGTGAISGRLRRAREAYRFAAGLDVWVPDTGCWPSLEEAKAAVDTAAGLTDGEPGDGK